MVVEEGNKIEIFSRDALANAKKDLEEAKKIVNESEKVKGKLKPKTASVPRGGKAPIETQTTERSGGIFGGPTDSKTKIKDKTSNQAFVRVSEFKKMQKKQKETEKKLEEVESKQDQVKSQIESGIFDPLGKIKSTALGAAEKIIPVAIITKIVDLVHERILKEFGPGGRLDVRKFVRDALLEFIPLELLEKIDRGEIFFGTSSTLEQGAPQFSNTESLTDSRSRDLQRNMGY